MQFCKMTCITIHIFYLIESEEVVSDDSDSDEMHKVSDASTPSTIDQGCLKLELY